MNKTPMRRIAVCRPLYTAYITIWATKNILAKGVIILNILFIHPSFPGQFLYLAPYLGKNPENNVVFLAENNSINANFDGVKTGIYPKVEEKRIKTMADLGPVSAMGKAFLGGEQILKAMNFLKTKESFVPDIIVGHTGWGNLMYVKDMYPKVPLLGYFEWYYHAENSDSYWWPDEVPHLGQRVSVRNKNAPLLLSLEGCDRGYCPTRWQYDQFPKEYRYKLCQQHDGVDTEFCSPLSKRPGLLLETEDVKLNLPEGSEILTYVSRGFEAVRGFPQFMDAVRIILKERPNCHVVIAGSDTVCYGAKLKDGKTYRQQEEEKGGYDKERVHFVGSLNRGNYQKMLRSSSCHIYLTRPFILSWSCLEAMSFGLPIVVSKTPPCEEVVEDGVNGMLAEFRSPQHIARKAIELLEDRHLAHRLGRAARETVLERYELKRCLHSLEDIMFSMVK